MEKNRLYREDYTDLEWFELMTKHGENLPSEFCDVFDRDGEVSEDYLDIFTTDLYIIGTEGSPFFNFGGS